jgi:hypothetical protein
MNVFAHRSDHSQHGSCAFRIHADSKNGCWDPSHTNVQHFWPLLVLGFDCAHVLTDFSVSPSLLPSFPTRPRHAVVSGESPMALGFVTHARWDTPALLIWHLFVRPTRKNPRHHTWPCLAPHLVKWPTSTLALTTKTSFCVTSRTVHRSSSTQTTPRRTGLHCLL